MGNLLSASEIVEFAVYIEQNGYKFYVETIKKFKEKKFVELFQFLADEELKHEQTFKALLKKTGTFAPPESYPGEYELYMREFLKTHALANDEALKQKLASISTPGDAIKVALDFEKDSIVLFTAVKKYMDKANHQAVESIIQEEMTHIIKITTYQQEQRL